MACSKYEEQLTEAALAVNVAALLVHPYARSAAPASPEISNAEVGVDGVGDILPAGDVECGRKSQRRRSHTAHVGGNGQVRASDSPQQPLSRSFCWFGQAFERRSQARQIRPPTLRQRLWAFREAIRSKGRALRQVLPLPFRERLWRSRNGAARRPIERPFTPRTRVKLACLNSK